MRFVAHLEPRLRSRAQKVRDVIDYVLWWHGLTYEQVMTEDRHRPLVRARWDCMVAIKSTFPQFSYPHIGRIFGRDHSTVLYGISAARRERKRTTSKLREQSGRSAPAMSIGVAAE